MNPVLSASPRTTHVIANQSADWCGNPFSLVFPRSPSFSLVLPRSPLAPTLGELAAEPTERVKIALPAPLGHLSHRERQVALIRLALAGDARATFPMGEGFGERIATPVLRHWFAMTPYIPVCRKNDTERYPAACRIQASRARIARRGSRLMSTGRTAWE